MNRFRILAGKEDEFVSVWRSRETYLAGVAGFQSFNLLRGSPDEECTLFASHSVWASKADFEAWTHSEAFRKAHAGASGAKGLYLGLPQFEGFEVVV
jgi:heme-degrading monooxygenase HmoA